MQKIKLNVFSGSGKSHTMIGSDADAGLVPRSVEYLLECIPGGYKFEAKFYEIYNENLIDLLDPNEKPDKPIAIHKIALANGTSVEKVVNLKSVEIVSGAHFNDLLKDINNRRKVSATARNKGSSRSHAVIEIKLEGILANEKGEKIQSNIRFLDLAGCESANDHLDNNDRAKTQSEMANINKSVNNFQTVIESLKNKEPSPDFRSSKLTYLLKTSLTMYTKTLMITTISQAKKYQSTSKASLTVTQSAGKIQIKNVTKNLIKV